MGVVDVLMGGGTGVSAGGLVGTVVVVTVAGGTGLVCPEDAAILAATIEESEGMVTSTGTGIGVLEVKVVLPSCGTGTGVSTGIEGEAAAVVGCGGADGGRGVI
jgi:hypothetical protein